jgi:hypothetical protein
LAASAGGNLRRAPAEAYIPPPPGSAAFLREGRETLYAQQSRKKKIMTTTKNTTIEGLPAITAQLVKAEQTAGAVSKPVLETAKFIIVSFQGREQVVAFPVEIQHDAMLNKIQRQHGNVQPISAGFFLGDPEKLWVGGESLTLELNPRPQDVELVRAFLTNPTPEFNFINGGAK